MNGCFVDAEREGSRLFVWRLRSDPTGSYQDFVDTAPLDLVYVAHHGHMKLVPVAQRERYAFAAAGAMAQNVYLYCAANGLATVLRAWFDNQALSQAMALESDQQLLLCQTVGRINAAGPA